MTSELRRAPARAAVLDDRALRGSAFCHAYSDATDAWLAGLFEAGAGNRAGLALVAVGGYGRGELCPGSDIDVVLLHDRIGDVAAVAERLWYPIWDEGVKLGHSVRTIKEATALADGDLETATALLDARLIAGDAGLAGALVDGARGRWQKRASHWLEALGAAVADRHHRWGEVAFLLEPDVKEARGGLRDVHALRWAEAARRILFAGDDASLGAAYDVLLEVRVELHRRTGRRGDRLSLEEQDGLAEALGDDDADALMARVATAARTIVWTSDETWRRIESGLRGPGGRASRDRPIGEGLVLRDGEVHLDAGARPEDDPVLPLRAAALAAEYTTRIDRDSLERLAAGASPLPDPWPDEARDRLVQLLLAGSAALPVIESLDQRGLWLWLVPEWAPVRSRPQRNAYHRFTVDRHLVEAAVNASTLAGDVSRPDLLVVGALLHDLGKGRPGDHTEVGMVLARTLGARWGFAGDDVDTLVSLVEHHLLLPDVATRRDLADEGTVRAVADAVQTVDRLRLLHALTEADSLATGPAAWGPWKAELVRELVDRVAHALNGGDHAEAVGNPFPDEAQQALLDAREPAILTEDSTLTVVDRDRPGLFSRVAGVLALNGLDVRRADASSTDDGMALAVFQVEATFGPTPDWERVRADLDRALGGRLALDARVAERAAVYERRQAVAAAPAVTAVTIENSMSAVATVVDVRAPDGVGVLYAITRALADLDLDIRSATVQTVGHQVIDSFYVRDQTGAKVVDPGHLAEIERAILFALAG